MQYFINYSEHELRPTSVWWDPQLVDGGMFRALCTLTVNCEESPSGFVIRMSKGWTEDGFGSV